MQNTLLGHIASNFIQQYENVANSSVAYLLNHYPAARQALMATLKVEKVPTHFQTELSTDKNGRPDISGLDETGNTIIIIEGKFWANLTDNQPNGYLKKISNGGSLLFLSPSQRVSSLESEIERRTEGKGDDRIKIASWTSFLKSIEAEK